MKTWLVVAAVVGLAAFVLSRFRVGDGPTIHVRDLQRAIAELARQGKNGAFLVVLFGQGSRGGDRLNLQLSIEKGRLGIDWVLLAELNVADRTKFEGFVRERGFFVREHEMNGVRYLRVEDGDLPALAQTVLTDLYQLAPGDSLDTVVEGFTLK